MSYFSNPDYIVIGSGSAGSTIAYRLAESGTNQVLALEFVNWYRAIYSNASSSNYPMNMSRYDWGYKAEPEHKLNNRSIAS